MSAGISEDRGPILREWRQIITLDGVPEWPEGRKVVEIRMHWMEDYFESVAELHEVIIVTAGLASSDRVRWHPEQGVYIEADAPAWLTEIINRLDLGGPHL